MAFRSPLRPWLPLALALFAPVVAAACGDDSSSDGESTGGAAGAAGAAPGGAGGAGGTSSGGAGGTSSGGSAGALGGGAGAAGSAQGGTAGAGQGGAAGAGGGAGASSGGTAGTGATGGTSAGGGGSGGNPGGPSVACGASACALPASYCCNHTNQPDECLAATTTCNFGVEMKCDGPEDCGSGQVCCGALFVQGPNMSYTSTSCATTCTGKNARVVCGASNSCPSGTTCGTSDLLPPYKDCK